MAIKILHTGDWHLGSFPGPEKNGENVRFMDIRKCLETLAKEAQENKPDIIVIAGDVFHQARTWSDRGLTEVQAAVKYIRALETVCPVVVMRGTPNHDGESHFKMLETAFEGDRDVHIVMEPKLLKLFTGRCGWVQIACVPGFDRGYYRAKNPGLSKEEENEVFTQSIEDIIIGLKAQCDDTAPTVLVSHYTIAGCNTESGQTAFFAQFEPIVYPSTLQTANFDLVCFGHIHKPQQIDGCKNTFYCGAISALNFNDEGQKRGYYIHAIEDNREVTSEFFELPTREYFTIRLNDDDIREINETGPEWLYKLPVLDGSDTIQNKIVRVLYDCTDEHNKAFNHATLENWLYRIGKAFWVQEITPQKISITANRENMDADDTPERNLANYLEEKGLAPERIGETVELARPIIAEVAEKVTQERHTGLFVPVEIEVKNYRNYREETFSFDDIRFCTINGSNGVGKSSLFMDAICDALFEETREGELTGWICNDPEARSGSIKFTFRLGDKLYRVTRTRQKSGKATLNIAECVDGEWVDRSKEKFKDTQTEIINIIGMDSLTLKACALIMQDQYGLFLQADKEARMNILGSILGLGIYSGMEELAAEKATETNREIRALQDRTESIRAGLSERADLEKYLKAATEEKETREAQAAEKTTLTDNLKVMLNTQDEAANRVIKLNGKISSLTSAIASKEATKTAQIGIITAADAILSEEGEISKGLTELQELLKRERETIKNKAEYDNFLEKKEQVERAIKNSESTAKELREKKAAITLMKIGPLKQAISRADELEARHREYEDKQQQLSEFTALEPEWKKAVEELGTAQGQLKEIESEAARTAENFEIRIKTLKNKVALLANSGCPDVEKANCKFLADALKAKAELPEVEKERELAAKEYESRLKEAATRLSDCQKVMDNNLYQPTTVDALRGDLRLLEVAEKEYMSLEGQRKELALMNERADELEKAITETETEIGDSKEKLRKIEARINAIAQVDAEYKDLQTKILVAKRWEIKERQLPVARERKTAAAQRVLELETEIESLEAEVQEAKTELAEEQGKTVGREHLAAQVRAAEREISELQEQAQMAAMTIGGLVKELERLNSAEAETKEIMAQIGALSKTAAGYEELKKAFSQDGIPHNIIRSIIPIFEATATNILGQMSGGKMSIEFVTEKMLKSNSKKEVTTLDVIINDSDTGRLPYMSRSGGERVKAALSVILALAEIKSNKAGIQLGFLAIDEAPFLDAAGTQAYCDALEAIQMRYPNTKILAITHDESFKARFPQSVTVYKDEYGSHIMKD